ncbi:ThuA domain-containing protein [Flagellimonas onchidii]|uniref:ThuA domain-containing protein n=1 Tax=Flagellimonas onchidii TaxID=2562684 RepID=UPI0010A5CC6E|nr:ThuA domain-containing protein [Allomuricauda onchidii]
MILQKALLEIQIFEKKVNIKCLSKGILLGMLLCCSIICLQAQSDKKIEVLIVDGFSNHDWKQTTHVVTRILGKSELFNVSVTTMPLEVNGEAWKHWNPKFHKYNVVIQNTNNINDTALRWPPKAERKLENYLKKGGGLYILHSANNAFPHWEEYNRIIGLGWRNKTYGTAIQITDDNKILTIPSGEGRSTYHGPRNDEKIHILNLHPINKGMPKIWISPDMELYKFARGPAEELTVLSYALDEETGIKWPVEWVVEYELGKVYNSSMGHLWKGELYPLGYRCIGFQTTLIRAVEWLGSGKVTYPIPGNFPSENKISLAPDNLK